MYALLKRVKECKIRGMSGCTDILGLEAELEKTVKQTHSIGEGITGKDGPGPPVCVMAEVLMDMLSQSIDVM